MCNQIKKFKKHRIRNSVVTVQPAELLHSVQRSVSCVFLRLRDCGGAQRIPSDPVFPCRLTVPDVKTAQRGYSEKIPVNKTGQKKTLKKKDRRNSDHKGPVARFVAEPVHTGQTSQGTAHPCRCEQHPLRNPPPVFPCSGFVHAEQQKPGHIYRQKITEEKAQLTHLIYRIMAQPFR